MNPIPTMPTLTLLMRLPIDDETVSCFHTPAGRNCGILTPAWGPLLYDRRSGLGDQLKGCYSSSPHPTSLSMPANVRIRARDV